jgi:hypothetical protein
MSEPSTIIPVSLSASGYEDGLGRRTLEFDREAGVMLERLHVRPELGAFEAFLRERVARSMSFDDERFARVRGMERDGRNVLTVVSQFVAGNRLCDLLEAATSLPADEATCPSVDAAIGFLLDVLPALGSLHTTAGHAHGTLGPGRIVLTPAGQVVILDSLFGPAIERLQFNRRRLWVEFGVATAAAAGPARLDITADIAQASLVAMMIVLGRPLRENEYPEGLPTLLSEVIEIAQIRGSGQFASGLHAFLQRTLPLPGRRPHHGAEEAAAEVQHIAREIGVTRCRAALTAFIQDMNRVLEDAREDVEDVAVDPGDEAMAAAVDAYTAELVADSEIALDDLPNEPEYAAAPDVFEDTTELPLAAVDGSVGADLIDPFASELPESSVALDYDAPFEETLASVDGPGQFRGSANDVLGPVAVDVPVTFEPISAVEPEVIPAARAVLQPEDVAEPVSRIAREPLLAEMIEPELEPAPVTAQKPQAPQSKRKRRGSKAQRDKLRSNAVPAPKPSPVGQAPVPSAPISVEAAATFGRTPEAVRQAPSPIGVRPASAPKPPAPLRLKTDAPAGYDPGRTRPERRESYDIAVPYADRDTPTSSGEFPWRLAAAAVVVMLVIVGAGRAYLPDRGKEAGGTPEAPAVAKHVDVATTAGSIAVTTQPAGAHVLLDGKAVGDTPLTLDGVVPGKHALTFVTTAGTVRKTVRVEAGKSVALDIPIYSGWIAVFSPIPLDIAENGRAIGTTEQGRLMLSPGRHQLSLTNRELGYKGTQVVDIDPGEERSISVQPTGGLNANAVPWAEVWMNGKKVGETPLAGLQVPLGTHEVVFRNPQFPERRVTVTVTAIAPAAASVDFSK